VLVVIVNVGFFGLIIIYLLVGGSMSMFIWWGWICICSDELFVWWTELEIFGPLLVTEDGDYFGDQSQVWDFLAWLAAFAWMSRVFAVLLDYWCSVVW